METPLLPLIKIIENGRKYLSTTPKRPVKSTTSGISHKGAIG